ncbi:MAG: hypothetical protein GKR90_22740 [Pseudomonadales bacterium]|nr:hypothetical protein [Pseudomonadales bacterium]
MQHNQFIKVFTFALLAAFMGSCSVIKYKTEHYPMTGDQVVQEQLRKGTIVSFSYTDGAKTGFFVVGEIQPTKVISKEGQSYSTLNISKLSVRSERSGPCSDDVIYSLTSRECAGFY